MKVTEGLSCLGPFLAHNTFITPTATAPPSGTDLPQTTYDPLVPLLFVLFCQPFCLLWTCTAGRVPFWSSTTASPTNTRRHHISQHRLLQVRFCTHPPASFKSGFALLATPRSKE